jgi:hypothetical protein
MATLTAKSQEKLRRVYKDQETLDAFPFQASKKIVEIDRERVSVREKKKRGGLSKIAKMQFGALLRAPLFHLTVRKKKDKSRVLEHDFPSIKL